MRKIIPWVLVGITLAGCDNKAPLAPGYVNPAEQSKQTQFSDKSKTSKLECLIIGAQPQSIPFNNVRDDQSTQNHPITYVPAISNEKRLVFVYSRAEVTYIPGNIDAETLLKNFVNSNFETQDNFPLNVNGVISPNGIKYQETK